MQLISSGGYYGAESMLLNLTGNSPETLSENLLAVFYNRHTPNVELFHRAVDRGVNAKLIPCDGRFDWQGVRDIRRLVRAHDIEILHTHGYKADLYGLIAARYERKPIVATCHNWLAGSSKLAIFNLLDRIALRHFDAIGAVSETIVDQLVAFGVPRERVNVIANGIDVGAFDIEPPPRVCATNGPKDQVLGMIGRLDLQKGFKYLLGAVTALRNSFPRLRLLIAGEGPDRGKIEGLISQHGLNSVVTMAGSQTDMASVYKSIDIFVLPSLNEGLPMTLLEAMAAGKAIIATRVGAVPQVITDQVTGLLVEPADAASLAQAISQLLSHPDLCRQLAHRARACVERDYTAAGMVQKYGELYTEVLARRSGRKTSQAPERQAGNQCPAHALSSEISNSPTKTQVS
jgi:glycosyltransferase involved in cell wall biosynthesis